MYDYVIIGGGISGLYMNMKLLDKTKNILLLEGNNYFGGRIYQYIDSKNNLSFPAGAARFNKSHIRVIKLLKYFNLLDFRKDKGGSSDIQFIDSKNQFNDKFKGQNGFIYIKKVLNKMKQENKNILMNLTFMEYSKRVLNDDELEFMITASGYSGQLINMNAYDAYNLFSTGIRIDVPFWGGKFHLLVNSILKYLKNKNSKPLKNMYVSDVFKKDDVFHVSVNKKILKTRNIMFCTPKESLKKFTCLNPIKCIINESISSKSLCRVYALFRENEPWIINLKKKTVVNNQLRYIIPMNPEKGLIMISYTDYIHTEYWNKKQNNQNELKNAIVRLVKQTFNITVKPPKKVYVCYWKHGVAYWNKGFDSKKISAFMTNPLPKTYICGENYSNEQSWVEGALESCERCLVKINI